MARVPRVARAVAAACAQGPDGSFWRRLFRTRGAALRGGARSYAGGEGGVRPPPAANALASAPGAVEADDDPALEVFDRLEGLSEETRHRLACTEAFVRILLTTPLEQEWRDMMAAALRAATWRARHFEAVLGGVRLLKYDLGTSTPTRRLRRARAILVFWVEEAAAGSPERPANRLVCALLTQLLRSARRPSTAAGASGIAPGEVWRFLAWMELHGFRPDSFELLDELARCIDGDDGGEKGAAAESIRRNRLEYLRDERARLRETGEGGKAPGRSDPPRRHVEVPRAEPQ